MNFLVQNLIGGFQDLMQKDQWEITVSRILHGYLESWRLTLINALALVTSKLG